MSRISRPALVLALSATMLLGAAALTGCMKKAPVLTPAQLQAGLIGEKHPVSQQKATESGCSCHLESAKAAGAK
jgi:hypothetical protein